MHRQRMSGVDAAWLHMDRPENTADVVALLSFSGRLRPERVRQLLEERVLVHRRFTQRVVHDALGRPWWEDDPGFSLKHHLRPVHLTRDGPALAALAGRIATSDFDRGHPPWRMHLVHGPGNRSALVVKLHHAIADGFALVSLLLSLADEPTRAVAPVQRAPSFRDLSLRGLPEGAVRATLASVASPGRALAAAGEAALFSERLGRMIALPFEPATPLTRPLSGQRRVAWSRGLPLAPARDAARAHGATLNDVIVAAIAGALRAWLAAGGAPVDRLRLRSLVPVNLRDGFPPPGDGALGNRFGLVFLPVPVHLPTTEERLAAVRESVEALKHSPDAVVTFAVLGGLGLLPAAADRVLTAFFSRKASLVVTNVPGPRTPLRLAGRTVEDVMFWVPHPATLGLGVSVLSYAGRLRIGVRADTAVMPDPAGLVAGIEAELGGR